MANQNHLKINTAHHWQGEEGASKHRLCWRYDRMGQAASSVSKLLAVPHQPGCKCYLVHPAVKQAVARTCLHHSVALSGNSIQHLLCTRRQLVQEWLSKKWGSFLFQENSNAIMASSCMFSSNRYKKKWKKKGSQSCSLMLLLVTTMSWINVSLQDIASIICCINTSIKQCNSDVTLCHKSSPHQQV